jgi:uncharacterized protein (DUF305 family)
MTLPTDGTPPAGPEPTDPSDAPVSPAPGSGTGSRTSRIVLIAAGALVLLLVGGTLGLALSGKFGSSAPATPDSSSVDAGFARDMIVHHDQGVLMAHYAEQDTTDPEISVMAYDLGYTQTDQIGQMQGWLSLWDLPESGDGTHMAWMGGAAGSHGAMDLTTAAGTDAGTAPGTESATVAPSGSAASGAAAGSALMPGMATTDEIDKLKGLTGTASDIYFLQLMVRHHQGGLPMMQYAAEHGTDPVVRNFADKMAQTQQSEISVMTQMLTQRGAEPLPAPTG